MGNDASKNASSGNRADDDTCSSCGASLSTLSGRVGRTTCPSCKKRFCAKCCSKQNNGLCEVCHAADAASAVPNSAAVRSMEKKGGFAEILGGAGPAGWTVPQVLVLAVFRKKEYLVILPAPTATVATLRAKLFQLVRVRPERMKMMFGGKLLRDERMAAAAQKQQKKKKHPETSQTLLDAGFSATTEGDLTQAEESRQALSELAGDAQAGSDLAVRVQQHAPKPNINRVMVMGTAQAEEKTEQVAMKSAAKEGRKVKSDLDAKVVGMSREREAAILDEVEEDMADASYFRKVQRERARLNELLANPDVSEGDARLEVQRRRQEELDRKRAKQAAKETKGLDAVKNPWADLDRRALDCPDDDGGKPWTVSALGKFLGEGLESNLDRARVVYRWVCANITYDVAATKKTFALPTTANQILTARTGMCGDYAVLFEALAHSAGIPKNDVVDISGHSKVLDNSGEKVWRLRPNHGWNAVRVESSAPGSGSDKGEVPQSASGKSEEGAEDHTNGWRLIDATWGSGFVDADDEDGGIFLRDFDEQWFCAPPHEFLIDHYPVKKKWQLQPKGEELSWKDWQNLPRVKPAFIKYQLLFEDPLSPPGDGSYIHCADRALTIMLSAPADVDISANMYFTHKNPQGEEVQMIDHSVKLAGSMIPGAAEDGRQRRLVKILYAFQHPGKHRLIVFCGHRALGRLREAFVYRLNHEDTILAE